APSPRAPGQTLSSPLVGHCQRRPEPLAHWGAPRARGASQEKPVGLPGGATAPPGRPERWGVWGAISGPPDNMDLTPVTLRGRWLTLEAIDERHAPGIFEVMRDDEVCRYLAWDPPKSLDETLALVREAKDAMARGQAIVYAQVWNATGRAIGSTRLLDVRPADRQVEIGSTFLGRDYWRTPANTESKYL